MKCTEISKHIDGYLDKQLTPRELLAFEQHVSGCSECAEKLETAESLLAGLKNLPVPQPSANFEQRVFAEVRRQHQENGRQHHIFRFATGFATAVLAGLAIWLVFIVYIPDSPVEPPQVVSVEINESQTIRLLFESQSDIRQVSLNIGLPDNIELEGFPGRKELSWQTSLQQGQNILALPVIAIGHGQGELLATLIYGGKVKIFRVLLKTTAEEAHLHPQNEAEFA